MEIEEIVNLKNTLEKEIKLFIVEKCSDFSVATGLDPTDISIDTVSITELGSRPKKIISDVHIAVEI